MLRFTITVAMLVIQELAITYPDIDRLCIADDVTVQMSVTTPEHGARLAKWFADYDTCFRNMGGKNNMDKFKIL